MRGKNLQPRLLYPARISFRFDREIKTYRQAKAKKIQHHQTSSTTNAKGTSLSGKHKKEKDLKKQTENKFSEWMKKQDPTIYYLRETHFKYRYR